MRALRVDPLSLTGIYVSTCLHRHMPMHTQVLHLPDCQTDSLLGKNVGRTIKYDGER